MENYPNCDKLAKVYDERMIIGQFLDWMCDETKLFICDRIERYDQYFPTYQSHEDILMKYFKIDKKQLEVERRAILDEQRELNKK